MSEPTAIRSSRHELALLVDSAITLYREYTEAHGYGPERARAAVHVEVIESLEALSATLAAMLAAMLAGPELVEILRDVRATLRTLVGIRSLATGRATELVLGSVERSSEKLLTRIEAALAKAEAPGG